MRSHLQTGMKKQKIFYAISWREILASWLPGCKKFNMFTALGREERTISLDLFWLDSSVTKIAKKFSPLATDFKVLTNRIDVPRSSQRDNQLSEKAAGDTQGL